VPAPIYVNKSVRSEVTEQEPPKPVQSSHSRPRRVAAHAVAYTLYAFGALFVDPQHIPASLRSTRNPVHTPANSNTKGRAPQFGSSQIVRSIPDSYGDSITK